MATKRFVIEVEEGKTDCKKCPFDKYRYCAAIRMELFDCYKYNLTTMKIKELEEENESKS